MDGRESGLNEGVIRDRRRKKLKIIDSITVRCHDAVKEPPERHVATLTCWGRS